LAGDWGGIKRVGGPYRAGLLIPTFSSADRGEGGENYSVRARLRAMVPHQMCDVQLLRPRLGMQLDAQCADDLENRVEPGASVTR
jgi:hypothetical protein